VGISDDIGLAPPRYSSQILKNLTQTMIGGMSAAASRIQDYHQHKKVGLKGDKPQPCFNVFSGHTAALTVMKDGDDICQVDSFGMLWA